ncbi:MAG: ribosomal large subunit pseudouridine synthase, RluD subfamily protein nonfunctional [Candidatus Saccharibacteria bacterium]|nr:ribosomal large subunit pseudouridine synthase, RluD subfamily protein nonfunctional [Candidatus Saccharibacteria bacterium]
MISFKVKDKDVGKRLDIFVIENIPELTRGYVKSLIDRSEILLNDQPAKAGERLKAGNNVSILYDLARIHEIPAIELPIIYEDDDCLVINKPVGVLTHSKGSFNPEATVATFIKDKVTGMAGDRAGIVHRLDRATSGVIIGAKSPEALAWLQKQFSTRKVHKTYQAIVAGHIDPPEAIIDMPIERNPKKPQSFRVGAGGRPATTHYKTLTQTTGFSLVELKPTTGRTHQLRVHLSQIGHPIVGDSVYDGQPADRLYLHALSLELTLPNRERKTFSAPLPTQFKEFLKSHDL